MAGIYLAEIGQVDAPGASRARPVGVDRGAEQPRDREVIADHLMVHVRSDESSFDTGQLERGDRVRVRSRVAGGWVAIDPPPTAIGWVEKASLEPDDAAGDRGRHRPDPAGRGSGTSARARVAADQAVVRSGQLGARMPGPPWVELPRGTMVRLVDPAPADDRPGLGRVAMDRRRAAGRGGLLHPR